MGHQMGHQIGVFIWVLQKATLLKLMERNLLKKQ